MHRRTFCAVAAGVALALAAGPATASAEVHPGAMTFTEGAQCTSNFVFTDGSSTYLGQAAHCSGTGAATETDGCDSASLPLGTPVEIDGASQPGTLVYNSWIAMQHAGETNADTCAYNDFALVKLLGRRCGVRQSDRSRLRRPGGPRPVRGRTRRHRLLVRQLLAAAGHHQAQPEAGRRRRERRQRLEPHRLHADPGRPRRLGQRVHERVRRGDRHAVDAGDRTGPGLQRSRRPAQGAELPEQLGRPLQRQPGQGHTSPSTRTSSAPSSAPRAPVGRERPRRPCGPRPSLSLDM